MISGVFGNPAFDKEMDAHEKIGTWKLVPLPLPPTPVIPSRWVTDIKSDDNGTIKDCKARIVARGDKQEIYVNYDRTDTPTMCTETLHLLLALMAVCNWPGA